MSFLVASYLEDYHYLVLLNPQGSYFQNRKLSLFVFWKQGNYNSHYSSMKYSLQYRTGQSGKLTACIYHSPRQQSSTIGYYNTQRPGHQHISTYSSTRLSKKISSVPLLFPISLRNLCVSHNMLFSHTSHVESPPKNYRNALQTQMSRAKHLGAYWATTHASGQISSSSMWAKYDLLCFPPHPPF